MVMMPGCKAVLLFSLIVLCAAGGCASQNNSSWGLGSTEMLKVSELEVVWQNNLPMKEGESLDRLFILDNRIYGLSDRNYIVSLNKEKGNVIFSRPLAETGFPVVGLELYGEELFSIIGNELVEINSGSGVEVSAKRLAVNAMCPAARNGSYFYVVGDDRRIHALRSKDKIEIFEAAVENDSAIISLIADENFVVFATDAGNVISITSDGPKRLWQFDTFGSIAGSIARDANSVFVASEDTNVYSIDINTGKLIWKYQMGAVLEEGPRVTDKVVYQYARDEGLTAIDKENGKLLWNLDEGVGLLAEAAGKAYVITGNGKLVVMDNSRAEKLSSADCSKVSRYVTNVADSKIYIADEFGQLACLQPIH